MAQAALDYEAVIEPSIELEFNEETVAALLEAERLARDPNIRSYTVEEALRELKR